MRKRWSVAIACCAAIQPVLIAVAPAASSAEVKARPLPPVLTASLTGDRAGRYGIRYAWSGGGGNGRPVAEYELCLKPNRCLAQGSSAGSTVVGVHCSASRATQMASAFVLDSAGTSSVRATAVITVPACAAPAPPTVSQFSASPTGITWAWSGGGSSDSPTTGYLLCPDNDGCMEEGTAASATVGGYGCGETHTAYVIVYDNVGQTAQSAVATGTTAACPPPQAISIGWSSNPAPAGNWLTVTWTGFPTGTSTFECDFSGTISGPYNIDLTSSPYTESRNTCYDAVPGETVSVITDGVNSNSIPSD